MRGLKRFQRGGAFSEEQTIHRQRRAVPVELPLRPLRAASDTAPADIRVRLGIRARQFCFFHKPRQSVVGNAGGFVDCLYHGGKTIYKSSRVPYNALAWFVDASETPCPYAEPTRNVGRWCIFATRDMNRWVQWQLKRHGADLDVDGVFGKLSDTALRAFQRAHGLTDDGICGKLTREVLRT